MAKPVSGQLGYDNSYDRPTVELRVGTRKLLTEDDSGGGGAVSDVTGTGAIDVSPTTGNVVVSLDESELENGGAQEISIAGLSGQAADGQRASALVTSGADVVGSAAAPPTTGQVPTATSATTFTWQTPLSNSPLLNINPRHYWRADTTVQSGGLVDTITDLGRVAKNFTQSGAARCPTATDGAGHTYLAPNGTADWYSAGVAADWLFMHDGTPWTIGFVWHVPSNPGKGEILLDTSAGTSASRGFYVYNNYLVTQWGIEVSINRASAGNPVIRLDTARPESVICTAVIKHNGDLWDNRTESQPLEMLLRRRGGVIVTTEGQGSPPAYSASAANNALTLFAANVGANQFFAGRLYEVWIEDRSVPDWQVQEYERWAATTYGAV